jgi:hypothetical protein
MTMPSLPASAPSNSFGASWFRPVSWPGNFMSISAGGNETKVGMARCAVPAAFSGGTLRTQGHELFAG